VCFDVSKGGTLDVSLQGGNPRLPSFLIRHYAARLLFCVASRSC
jgi:hypothetical protein